MASLVADYSDSESENESESTIENNDNETNVRIKEEPGVDPPPKTRNFFDASENSDEDDSAVGSNNYGTVPDVKPNIKQEPVDKLPNPLSNSAQKLPSIHEAIASTVGKVFVNPFEEAEKEKNQILEKHVKLTKAAPKKPAHQPVCWKFKKGKCHLGKNCRFFHDMENRTLEENNPAPTDTPPTENPYGRATYHPAAYFDARQRPFEQEPVDDDNYMASARKKKRYGVSDNLVPPQKAFESLQRQREKERPWTVNK